MALPIDFEHGSKPASLLHVLRPDPVPDPACGACGSLAPAGARFCPSCGQALADERPRPVSRLERRQLTVLFADLAGSTSAADGADVEDVHAQLRVWQELARDAVLRHGGTLARVMGDGIMAVWGYPATREDDAERAVRAALEMLAELGDRAPDLGARVGINTGEALVEFDAPQWDADDVVGDAVNVAARLEAAAAVGSVLVGQVTATLLPDGAVVEAMPPLALKGKAQPVLAWRVDSVGDAAGGERAAHLPTAGREQELASLRRDVDAARVQAVRRLVIGEPGVGKTRLLADVRRAAMAEDPSLRWFTGRCRDDLRSPGLALGDVVRTWTGITADDDPALAHAKLEAVIPTGTADRSWLLARAAPLAGLPSHLPPDADEQQVAWVRLLGLLAASGPAVVVFEDVHWADRALLEMLSSGDLGTLETPLAILATARPEVAADERLRALVADALVVDALDPGACDVLARAALGPDAGEAGLRALVTRSGGNPLFLLELARLHELAGGDPGASLPPTVTAVIGARLDRLPREVVAVARAAAVAGGAFVDDLLVSATGQPAEVVASALATLREHGFLRRVVPSPMPGHRAHAFRHALQQDVAAANLTRRERARLHATAARWLAAHAPHERSDVGLEIAAHWSQALELGAAAGAPLDAPSRIEAGTAFLVAARNGGVDVAESITLCERAIATLPTDDPRHWDAYAIAALAEDDAGLHRRAVELLEQGLASIPGGADARIGARLVAHLVRERYMAGDDVARLGWLERLDDAVAVLGRSPLPADRIQADLALVWKEGVWGTGPAAIAAADRAIATAQAAGLQVDVSALLRRGSSRAMAGSPTACDDLRSATDLMASRGDLRHVMRSVGQRVGICLYLGDTREARTVVEEALAIARQLGARSGEPLVLFMGAVVRYLTGELASAADMVARLLAANPEPDSGWAAFGHHTGWLVADAQGDHHAAARALAGIRAACGPASRFRTTELAPVSLALAARSGDAAAVEAWRAELYRQDPGELDAHADFELVGVVRSLVRGGFLEAAEQIASTMANPSPFGLAIADAVHGLVALGSGRADEARTLLERAEHRFSEHGLRLLAAEATLDVATAATLQGDGAAGQAAARRAADAARAMGASRIADEAEVLVSERGGG